MLKPLKKLFLSGAKVSGLYSAFSKSDWRRNKLLILAYHGVSLADEHLWNPSLFVTPELLRRRFELIRDADYNVLPLAEAIRRLYDQTLPDRAVTITFDDGFYNFYRAAWPVIKDFGYPATLYLTTFYSDFNRPVFATAADYLLWKSRSKILHCGFLRGRDEDRTFTLADPTERQRAHGFIVAHALTNNLSAEEKHEVLRGLCQELGIDFDEFCGSRLFQLVDGNETAEMSDGGVDIQMHTHRHRAPIDRALFLKEVDENRRHIKAITGKSATHFCYPSGLVHKRFPKWLRSTGVVSAVTSQPGIADSATGPFLLPRLTDSSSLSEVEFEGWLTGVSRFLPTREHLSAGLHSANW